MSEELSLDGKIFESYLFVVHPMLLPPDGVFSSLALPTEEALSYS